MVVLKVFFRTIGYVELAQDLPSTLTLPFPIYSMVLTFSVSIATIELLNAGDFWSWLLETTNAAWKPSLARSKSHESLFTNTSFGAFGRL